jgi:hypothetical protein
MNAPGSGTPEGAAGDGFAAMLAGTDIVAAEGETALAAGGVSLPVTGNPLPLVPQLFSVPPPPAASPTVPVPSEPAGESKGEAASSGPALTPKALLRNAPAKATQALLPTSQTSTAAPPAQGAQTASAAPLATASPQAKPQAELAVPIREALASLVVEGSPAAPSAPVRASTQVTELPAQPAVLTAAQLAPLAQPQTQAMQSAAPAASAAAAQPAPDGQLETLLDSLVQARESGRAARGEIVLRHAEFGAIAVRLDQHEGDLLARISSRDPGFAPAAQAALTERPSQGVAASVDSQSAQNRSQDGAPSPGHSRDTGFAWQQDRSGSGREQGTAATPQEQTARPQPSTPEQPDASPRERGLLA